jgi:hypothetical protein
MSNSENFSLLPYEQWWSAQQEGLAFHDPVSGQRLDPNAPPDFLLKNGRLLDGHDYIIELLSDISLGVYHTGGETRAEDLGGGLLEEIVEESGHVVRAIGHGVDGVFQGSGDSRELLPYRRNSYTERIVNIARPSGLAVFCVGLEVDMHGKPATSTERTLQAIGDVVNLQQYKETDRGAELQTLGIIARNALQWYRVLSAGERLQHESTKLIARGDGPLLAAVIAASLKDSDLGRKFQALGMANVTGIQAIPDTFTDEMNFVEGVMAKGYIPYDWLNR